jgi:hypothetical protein
MPRNATTGIYQLPAVYLAVPGQTILVDQHNQPLTDIQTVLNEAWPFDLTGKVTAPDGTAALPSITFLSDLDTGWYRIGANNFGASVGGFKVLDVSSTSTTLANDLTVSKATPAINLTAAASGQAASLILNTGALKRWTIRKGTGSETGSNAGSDFALIAFTDDNSGSDTPVSIVRAPGGTATISRPLSVTAGQITFPAIANPSSGANTLDDYEEGTGTTQVNFGGAHVGMTQTANAVQFTKVGNSVTLSGRCTLSVKGSSTGAATIDISGVPTPSVSFGGLMPVSFGIASNFTGLTGALQARMSSGLSIGLRQSAATGNAAITDTSFTATTDFEFTVHYFTA